MSDGDNATPGPPRLPGPPDPGDNQWLTRSPRPSPGAAPWERSGTFRIRGRRGAQPTGNHTDGVTVADLIAKVHGDRECSGGADGARRTRTRSPHRRHQPATGTADRGHRAVRQPAPPTQNSDRTPKSSPSFRLPPSELPDLARRAPGRPGAAAPASATGRSAPRRSNRAAAAAGRWSPAAPLAAADRRAGAGADRRGVAVAVVEEQHAQQGLRAGPGFARHPRPERTVR